MIKILPRKSYLCITHLFFAVCNLNASSLQAYEKSILPLQEGQPLEHDITLLKPYFKPTIGDFIYLRNVRTDQSKKMEQLEGSILVSPPKNHCITIEKSLDEPDVIVCEPKEVAFKLTNIDPEGRVRWIIKTGKVSTPVTWPTRYRIGKVVDLKMKWPGRAKRIAVLDCKVVRNSTSGRRVYVKVSGQDWWTISFPSQDRLTNQPPPRKNLIVEKIKQKQVVDKNIESESSPPIIKRPKKKSKFRWDIHPRDSFEMNGSNFITTSSNPKNSKGVCRYKYSHRKDKNTGAIECHNVDAFKWVFLPLTCLPEITQR